MQYHCDYHHHLHQVKMSIRSDRVCKRPWNFERVPNKQIEGNDKALIFTSTKEACLAACLNEVCLWFQSQNGLDDDDDIMMFLSPAKLHMSVCWVQLCDTTGIINITFINNVMSSSTYLNDHTAPSKETPENHDPVSVSALRLWQKNSSRWFQTNRARRLPGTLSSNLNHCHHPIIILIIMISNLRVLTTLRTFAYKRRQPVLTREPSLHQGWASLS